MGDRELIKLLKKNPAKGFDTMTAQYGGLLYTLVRSRLSAERYGSAEVEDIVADTLSDFYLHLDSFDPARCSIKSYLCVIARNKATDVLRKAKLAPLPLEEAEDVIDLADDREEEELRAELLREIQDLGEPDSIIIIRKYYLGQPSKAIAAAMDMTPANVDTRAHRAIEKLRRILL
ncbi:MAG: sigma-70 family RNA polymerase sigma factor [Ruminococcus sp.]|nr:sigma-70 family RNA polymerase sigma factor [Ruminococcus sp.]